MPADVLTTKVTCEIPPLRQNTHVAAWNLSSYSPIQPSNRLLAQHLSALKPQRSHTLHVALATMDSSPFGALPSEVRIIIYEHTLTFSGGFELILQPRVIEKHRHRKRKRDKRKYERVTTLQRRDEGPMRDHLALSAVCKEMRTETTQVLPTRNALDVTIEGPFSSDGHHTNTPISVISSPRTPNEPMQPLAAFESVPPSLRPMLQKAEFVVSLRIGAPPSGK